ncbi:hypothetical protein B0I73DRAFT_133743 [Yarrowia lipolytica]|uniref:ER transporter 6TM N-terminal domain-containing protein n=1 Tax=Yarrowia lipolytica TaxID=4952 RepID=A0A371C667_YARLL|nr:hypothetical protein B0I71DRAFT_132055 [Yarrowia lipolytica]RDW38454.1 hypothetical protein B0I73DRAFT_133743 [Yarrowia lipolytica]RDW44939.1 hypothetical protein B0I74DRAFT_139634 [Yarrowia lipolytica]RDW51763.1 hypothetical protein B0I75DRAFT_139378 [Yarrowia lipolytica]
MASIDTSTSSGGDEKVREHPYKRTLTGHALPYNRAYPNRPEGRAKQPFLRHYFRPSWVVDHLDFASFKVASRTWVGIWFGLMLMMIPGYVKWLGRAPYLTAIIGVIVPSGDMSVTVCFIVNAGMMLFTVFGWIVMTVAMYINNKYFHDSMTPKQMTQILIERGICKAPTDPTDPKAMAALQTCAQGAVFDAQFMTAKGSIVYAVLMGCFAFFLLWVKNKSRIIIPGYVCGIIAMSVLLTVGPMVPYYQPITLGVVLLKPVGLQCAINFSLSVLIFPFTTGFQFTKTVIGEISVLSGLVDFHQQFLGSSLPSNESEWLKFSEIEADVTKARQLYPKMQSESAMLHLELSFARFCHHHYEGLKVAVGRLTSSMAGLVYFYDNIENIRRAIIISAEADEAIRAVPSQEESETVPPVGVYEMKSGLRNRTALQQKATLRELTMQDLDLLILQLRQMSTPFIQEVCKSLDVIKRWLEAANVYRGNSLFFFWMSKSFKQQQKQLSEELRERYADFQRESKDLLESKRFALFGEHEENTKFVTFFFQGALYCGYMKNLSDSLDFLYKILLDIDEKHATPSWRFGKGIKKAKDNKAALYIMNHYARADENHLKTTHNEDLDDLFNQTIHYATDRRRNPDAMPPSTPLHKFGARFRKEIIKLGSPSLFVPLKGAVFTVLSASPCFFTASAPWFYKNKIMWMVIMTGLSISENMADNLYGFIARILYSFYAGVIAMVAWYISTGNGNGNRAGFMVVICILYFALSYYREFAQHTTPMPTIVLVVTTVIILGLSWTDGMGITTPTIGVGYAVAWKRFVTVVMGLTVGFVCSCVPRPVTGKRLIRKTLASIIKDTGTLFCRISDFGATRLANPDIEVNSSSINDPIFGAISNGQSRIAGTRFLASMIQFEPSLQGRWPSKTYREVTNIVSELVELHHHLYVVLQQIGEPRYWLPHLLKLVGWKNQPLMSHYFAVLYMAQGALYDGSPLPQVTPAMLMVEHLEILERQFKNTYDATAREAMGDTSDMASDDGTPGLEQISLQRLKTTDGLYFSASIVLSNCIFDRMDRLMFQVKTLVGEQFVNADYYRDDEVV